MVLSYPETPFFISSPGGPGEESLSENASRQKQPRPTNTGVQIVEKMSIQILLFYSSMKNTQCLWRSPEAFLCLEVVLVAVSLIVL